MWKTSKWKVSAAAQYPISASPLGDNWQYCPSSPIIYIRYMLVLSSAKGIDTHHNCLYRARFFLHKANELLKNREQPIDHRHSMLRSGTFFTVTNILLVLFAAGLLAHGVQEFNEAGIIPPVIEHVWDINPLLNEKEPVGQLLTAIFGYNGNPALTEILAYVACSVAGWVLWIKLAPAPARKLVV